MSNIPASPKPFGGFTPTGLNQGRGMAAAQGSPVPALSDSARQRRVQQLFGGLAFTPPSLNQGVGMQFAQRSPAQRTLGQGAGMQAVQSPGAAVGALLRALFGG